MAIEDFLGHFGFGSKTEEIPTPDSNVPYQMREDYLETLPYEERPDFQAEQPETPAPTDFPFHGKGYGMPASEFAPAVNPSQPGDSSVPYQQRPDYKASKKKSMKSDVIKSLVGSLNRQPAVEPQVNNSVIPSFEPRDLMADPKAKLDEALVERENRMNQAALRGATTDFVNAGMLGMGIDHKFTPGYAHDELKRAEDIKLKNLNEGLALSGKVAGDEKSKIDLNNNIV